MAHVDLIEMMIREKEAKKFIMDGKFEDAIAYAMACGTRMGWDAHKKKVESDKNK